MGRWFISWSWAASTAGLVKRNCGEDVGKWAFSLSSSGELVHQSNLIYYCNGLCWKREWVIMLDEVTRFVVCISLFSVLLRLAYISG